MVLVFFLFYLVAIFIEKKSNVIKTNCLLLACVVLAFWAGFRNFYIWPDTIDYVNAFIYNTPSLVNFHDTINLVPYSEKGFYYFSVFVKTLTKSSRLYLFFVSCVTFIILYKDFKKYTPYPLLGLCTYIARFYFGRNFIQIRAGIAYAIILLGIRYVTERNWKKYFLLVFIAYLFHQSALIAIPLYFMGMFKIKKQHVVFFIGLAFVLAIFFTSTLQNYVTDNASDLNVTSYVTGVEVEKAKGLANPMIYFQCLWLFLFTFGEEKIKKFIVDYYSIRNAYLLSTFILITFSMFLGLSGRTSTCFATMEFVIIPSVVFLFKHNIRFLFYIVLGIMLTGIFIMNSSLAS